MTQNDQPETTAPKSVGATPDSVEALPRVGTPAGTLPSQGVPNGIEEVGERSSHWWSDVPKTVARKTPRSGSESSGRQRGWTTSAGEEMEKFRRLPVVGRLPWLIQYAIALSFLALSLVGLIIISVMLARQGDLVAREASSDLTLRQTIQSIGTLRQSGAGAADETRLSVLIGQGFQAIENLSTLAIPGQAGAIVNLKEQWASLKTAVSEQNVLMSSSQTMKMAALDVNGQLGDLLPRLQAAAQQVGSPSPSLIQVIADLNDWYEVSSKITSQNSAIPDRLLLERQRVEQLLRAFASQPNNNQSPEFSAWKVFFDSWPTLQPRLDAVLLQREAWAVARGGTQSIGDKTDAISQTLNGLTATSMAWQANQGSLRSAAWLIGALASFALALFLGIAWKQQHFRVLEALAQKEKNRACAA